jgi:transposase
MRQFKTPNRDQLLLFPPNLNDWIRGDHPARFVLAFVETLNLTEIYSSYREDGRGQPPYDPKMMVAILLYACMLGVSSSRRIERLLTDDVGFRFIAGNLCPDHDTIADFRSRHHQRLADIFKQSVHLAVKAGIVRLGHVAIDGTKVRANASQGAKKTSEQLNAEISAVEKFVGKYFDDAAKTDEKEDEQFGKGRNGYFLPDFLQSEEGRKQWIEEQLAEQAAAPKEEPSEQESKRSTPKKQPSKLEKKLRKLQKAKRALEEKEEQRQSEDPTGKRQRDNERKRGTPYVPKVNVTDPDARTMLCRDGGYQEAYNCQIAVDDEAGIIVAAVVTQDANDLRQLEPMLLQTQANTGWLPDNISADTGYFNVQQMENPLFRSVEFFVSPKAETAKETEESKSGQMRSKLETDFGKFMSTARKGIVENVFGAIKHARRVRQLAMRGKDKVTAEWHLLCTAHNLLKLYKLGVAPA